MGKAAAKSCLLSGGQVVLVSRTASKLEAARTELIAQTGVDPSFVDVEACDCTSTDAVKDFFDKRSIGEMCMMCILSLLLHIHVLIQYGVYV